MPSREGEQTPCRRLALLQLEAQLPVTRLGEQGVPPRRVGRLLSGCGARPPSVPGSTGSARAGRPGPPSRSTQGTSIPCWRPWEWTRTGPTAAQKSSLSPPHSFGCSLSEPPRVEQPMGADRKERDRLRQQVDRVPEPAATLRRPWPSAPATGPPQYDRTVSDFLLWKERPGHLHLLPARAGPTRADNRSKVRWSEDVGWLRQLRKALSRSRSQQGGD